MLRKEGYYVTANTAYVDPETGKSRELDVYATTPRNAGPEEFDFIWSVLLVECVNNPQPIAFITKEPQVPFLHADEVKLSGLPAKIWTDGDDAGWESVPDFLGMDGYHHYCKGRIATQFCSFVKKKGVDEWMAFHEEGHFNSLVTLSTALEHFSAQHFKSWHFRGPESLNIEFYYPVIVLQGELVEVRQIKRSVRLKSTDHVQYRRSSFVQGEEAEYQIDVVTERYFPRYLNLIRTEISKTARLLRRRHAAVRKSIEKIRRAARKLRSPEKIRGAMEW
jgi:hypothetical protein